MIPYLSWLCYWGKGSISKYGIRSQLKSCKMNTIGHEESIKNMFLCVELCLLFSAGQLINSMRMRCQAVVQALGSSTRYWALFMTLSLKSMNIDEIKDPCDIKHENPCKSSPCHFINFVKIHANQAHVTSFVYVFVVVNVMNVLWD